jgi:putative protein-disulfide isomerase
MDEKPELIYVGDPMCSWCWGVAPTVEQVAKRRDIRFRLVVGGLRVGDRVIQLDDEVRRSMSEGWIKVQQRSGQPFNPEFLQRERWEFNTELPAIAITTMRWYAPLHALAFFTHLQGSFFRDGVDITDHSVYPALIDGFPVDQGTFMRELVSESGRERALADFAERRALGVGVLPTVLVRIEDAVHEIRTGYFDRGDLDDPLVYWVEGRQPLSASVGVCSPDGSTC